MTSTYGDNGAGGKLKRQSHRKHQSTPYSRPPTQLSKSHINQTDNNNNSEAARAGWFSKIVDPAYRIISNRATKFIPSFFSKSSSSVAVVPSPDHDEDEDSDVDNNGDDQDPETDLGSSRLPEEAGHFRPESNLVKRQENTYIIDEDSRLSEIEQLMRGKLFSRDEADRLTEILQLKAARNSVDQGEMRNVTKTRQIDPCIDFAASELPRLAAADTREHLNYSTWEHVTTTPVHRPILSKEVGASPADIARAYMEGISTGVGTSFRSAIQDKNHIEHKDVSTPLPMLPPSSSKASICWPGAMVQEHRGYLTPQNPRSKYGLYSSQRSPYSRTIDSKSKLKHQLTPSVDRRMRLPVSDSPYNQILTPGPSQEMSIDDSYRSVGPIRSVRHNKLTQVPSRGSTILASSRVQKPTADHGTLPVFKSRDPGSARSISEFQRTLNLPGSQSLASGIQSPHSSQLARRILDHIDRKVPTLKEKTEEIRIASLGQKISAFKQSTSLQEKGKTVLSNGQNLLASNLFGHQDQGGDAGSSDSIKVNAPPFKFLEANEDTGGKNIVSSFSNQANGQSRFGTSFTAAGSELPVVIEEKPSHSFGNKPTLSSISIDKPNRRSGIAIGNSLGFSFPVPASSEPEPPTPSITPAKVLQQNEGPSVPIYTFGSKKISPSLVFLFESTNSLVNQFDKSDIKFLFGSDTTNRNSFSAFS